MQETSRNASPPERNAFPDPSVRGAPGRDDTAGAEAAFGLQQDLEECFKAIREQLSEP